MIHKGPRLTAIGSGKGGTGKTFIAVALAQAFANLGERVLLCDADLGLSNTSVQLGVAQCGNLPALLVGTLSLQQAVSEISLPPHAPFDLLAAPPGTGFLSDADVEIAERMAALLKRAAGYDRVLLDLGAGVGSAVLTLAANADDAVVLMTPDPSAITDAYAFVKLFLKRTGGRVPALAVNMAANTSEAKRTADSLIQAAQTFLKAAPSYLGFIPNDSHVVEAIRHQTTLFTLYPQCAAALAVARLATALGVQTGRPQLVYSLR